MTKAMLREERYLCLLQHLISEEKVHLCTMEHFICSDEDRKSISKLMWSIIELKYSNSTKYESYILSQLNFRKKGNYYESEDDRYAIPTNPSDPPKDKDADEELDCQWICKGFWCFLTGVSKDTFQLFDQKHKDQLTTPSPFSYTSGSSAESTDDISDVSDQDFVENIVSSVASCEGDVDEQYSLWVKNL